VAGSFQRVGPFTSPATYIYYLRCTDGLTQSPSRQQTLSVTLPPPEDGECGRAMRDNIPLRSEPSGPELCNKGTPDALRKDTAVDPNLWKWSCLGKNGSTVNATCSIEAKSGFDFVQF
jgi:hypothetical protein